MEDFLGQISFALIYNDSKKQCNAAGAKHLFAVLKPVGLSRNCPQMHSCLANLVVAGWITYVKEPRPQLAGGPSVA
ncbi:MAG: hypothetical protein JJ868_03060 [Shimia sp.]|uniref:hypothetical protein n=1 Tax=Shimia sp. TaxID=1954381 RepID=UPI001B1AD79A|nr:hypothetical protein [Shimia sp.]MBO6896330.1 hypothetical protein [Shimia sp.]